jgi:hypothetical protein
MNIAITSIQRNRAPWLMEWLAFHMVVGISRFFMYTHKCDDGSTELLVRLSRHYPIVVHPFDAPAQAQLIAYQHAWNNYGAQVDWMAFIDGDEFLFPTAKASLAEALAPFTAEPISAIAAFWMCYGSSGHVEDPGGLLLEQFTRHANLDFSVNRHVKSIVRGSTDPITITSSHIFTTLHGTVDSSLRPIDKAYMDELDPCYEALRINHYVTQCHDFFRLAKQTMGAADAGPDWIRPDSWFEAHDRNECDDGVRYRFLLAVKLKLREMHARLDGG